MWIEVCLAVLLLIIYIYHYVTKQFNTFRDQGVPYLKATFPFGSRNSWKCLTGKKAMSKIDAAAVEECPNEKIFGYFAFGQPIWIINDEELAKRVMIKDFDHFMDRRVLQSDDKYFDNFMSNLRGNDWKRMRSMMSGVFTSGKLRLMTKHIANVGINFEKYIEDIASKGLEIETKEAGGKMSLDSIATVGFGIQENSFVNPENQFRIMALTLVGAPGYSGRFRMIKAVIMMALPFVGKLMGWSFIPKIAVNFFADIIRRAYKQRRDSKVKRNDFIDLIIEEYQSSEGSEKREAYENDFEKDAAFEITGLTTLKKDGDDELTQLIANVLLFFFAGFETTSLGFTAICHKLALFPAHQEKVLDEIDDKICDEENVTYDQIQSLKNVDMFIFEAFRISHLVSTHERQCTKDYTVPGTNFVIQKGRYVKVFTEHISMSENSFKNPKEFDPENYAPENNTNKFGTMIFGQGPRNCIGMRYAMLTLKIAVVFMLRKHRVVKSSNTPLVMERDVKNPRVFKDPVFVKFERR